MILLESFGLADGWCAHYDDETHCPCWWDGEPCCGCGFAGGEVDEAE